MHNQIFVNIASSSFICLNMSGYVYNDYQSQMQVNSIEVQNSFLIYIWEFFVQGHNNFLFSFAVDGGTPLSWKKDDNKNSPLRKKLFSKAR